jgi:hypothetical protein
MSIVRIFLFTDRLYLSESPLARFLFTVVVLSSVIEPSLGRTEIGVGLLSIDLTGELCLGLEIDLIGSRAPNVLLQGISFGMSC